MRRRVLSIQRAARSKYFRSAHLQVLSGKQTIEKKKKSPSSPPVLSRYLYVCGSIYLLIDRKETRFRMAAGNERRRDKKTTAWIMEWSNRRMTCSGGEELSYREQRGIMGITFRVHNNRKLILPGYAGYPQTKASIPQLQQHRVSCHCKLTHYLPGLLQAGWRGWGGKL